MFRTQTGWRWLLFYLAKNCVGENDIFLSGASFYNE